jgi:putative sterol carrier protein
MLVSEFMDKLEDYLKNGSLQVIELSDAADRNLLVISGYKVKSNLNEKYLNANCEVGIGKKFANLVTGAHKPPGESKFLSGHVQIDKDSIIYAGPKIPKYETVLNEDLRYIIMCLEE